MKIGYRTLKTAVGTSLSIFLAQWLGLQFAASAGILTILSVQVTKKRSIKNAFARFFSCVLGLLFGLVLFSLLGYHPVTIFILLLCLIPLLVRLRIQEGFVTACVILFHLYTTQKVSVAFFTNELAIMSIGLGIGLLMNIYMPSMEIELKKYQQKIEANFRVIMKELVVYLRNHESSWDGHELLETPELINTAKSLAIRNVENHLFRKQDHYYHYFHMREQQFYLLERMVPLISTLLYSVSQGEKIADFLDDVSDHIHSGNTAYIFLAQIQQLKREFEQTELPKSREEFEIRANLFYFLQEMERYLLIKDEYIVADSKAQGKSIP
ncbi:aromatic acid exporter family protein [Aneurinibacillus uraniidurans]|uniref:aromatic acid exporter family protein n=1 Tax=Aneurinibacillus uraniidurans TaxID=2966586 RepID=UPI0023499B4A|nr:aromatic acid exporter family protein [Aneurinibacillus sp. B1]WCN39456.1 aromatic acid exporter family protein [Aneurinibacillus sp. B1]